MIKLKRAYDGPSPDDGPRFLVERLWPRGVKKESLRLDAWLKDVAPSDGLRRWFGHDPKKWGEFQRRYFHELDENREAWEPILKAARRARVTLVYSARDTEHNNAVALKDYLEAKMGEKQARGKELLDEQPERSGRGRRKDNSMYESTDLSPGPLHRFLADDHSRLDGLLARATARAGFDREAAQLFPDGDEP